MIEPYREAAWAYRRAGWVGVLPLPPGRKTPPPGGYTGWAGVEPSGADVQAWVDGPTGAGNIALHLPAGVYGLDVDDYGGKAGGAALERLVEQFGPLPPTWIVSSREASASGIRLFRAEPGLGRVWIDEPAGHGAGIEAIHRGHRYAVVWPSVHPETGRKYAWRRPDGIEAADGEVPELASLPELPAAWVEGLSKAGEVRVGEVAGHAETVEQVTSWRDGEPCPRVRAAYERAMGGLSAAAAGAALHPVATTALHELVNLGHEGHVGVRRALAEHFGAFVEVRTTRALTSADPRDRTPDARRASEGEWWRMVRGAVGKLIASARREVCDCEALTGAGLLFEPYVGPDAIGPEPVVEPLAVVEAPVAVDPHAAAVLLELERLRIRHEAEDLLTSEQHARRWREPVSHGTLAAELLIPDLEQPWRIHNLLGVGHNAILVAGRKAGKTTMVNEFIRSYVDGDPFLEALPVLPTGRGVAVFNYEVGEDQYRSWLRAVGIHNTERVHVLHLRGRSLPMVDPRIRAWVTHWLNDRDIGAWVLDPYSRAYIGSIQNGNSESEVSGFLDTLDQIKADASVDELVMPVHTPKARAESGEESAIGSQRLEGWPDVMWYLTRDGATRFIRAEGRDIDLAETELGYSETTRHLKIELFGQDRRTVRLGAAVLKLIAFVHANPECTQNMIMTGLGWNAKTVREAVGASAGRVMVQSGSNRALIHILREDLMGVTQIESHTASSRVTPEVVSGVTLSRSESHHHTTGSVTQTASVIPNPFDLGDPS